MIIIISTKEGQIRVWKEDKDIELLMPDGKKTFLTVAEAEILATAIRFVIDNTDNPDG